MDIPSISDLMSVFPEVENQYLFHYTTYSSALNILLSQQLRLGPLAKMNDPLEFEDRLKAPFMCQGVCSDKEYMEKASLYEKAVTEKEKSVRFTSFSIDNYSVRNIFSKGWARSRMWAQYADKHKGVCLVFDKANLIKAFESKYTNDKCRTYWRKINYTNNLESLRLAFSQPCESFLTDDKIEFLFQKCEDYRDEQEFRLLLINKGLNDSKEMESFSIADSVCGIVTGVNFPKECELALKKAVESCNPAIKMFPIIWTYGTPGLLMDV